MPQSIPFDPSLTLGNIVHPEKITALQAVDDAQQPINLAQEKLNSLILAKRSLDMTVQQMIQMQVTGDPMKKLITQVNTLKTDMAAAAGEYAAATVTALPKVQKAQEASSKIILGQLPQYRCDVRWIFLRMTCFFQDINRFFIHSFSSNIISAQ